jgi:molybdopterin-guanine dinucleotide biosynthesis protein A
VPCDSPFLPPDLVARLRAALFEQEADLAVASARGRQQPVFSLCHRRLHAGLRAYLAGGGRKIDHWYSDLRLAEVAFDDQPEAFDNINTADELSDAQRRRASARP